MLPSTFLDPSPDRSVFCRDGAAHWRRTDGRLRSPQARDSRFSLAIGRDLDAQMPSRQNPVGRLLQDSPNQSLRDHLPHPMLARASSPPPRRRSRRTRSWQHHHHQRRTCRSQPAATRDASGDARHESWARAQRRSTLILQSPGLKLQPGA